MIFMLIVLLLITFYFYGTRNYDYWSKRGVKFEKPIIFFGSNLKQFIDNVSVSRRFAMLHQSYPNEKFVGFFEGNNPGILFRDPDLIKHVLLTDFRYFHQRGVNPCKDAVEPLMKNIFAVDGDMWKLMRQKLTPTFSSAKLKAMFPLIIERTERLAKLADDEAEKDETDVRELMARYTTDFIGACGFGIEADCLQNENSEFRKLGRRIFMITKRDLLVSLLKRMFPVTFKHLQFFAPEVQTSTVNIVKEILVQRNYKPSGRNDFIDMLLELKQKGHIVGESIEKFNPDGTPAIVEFELDDILLASQVFVFFAAGQETSAAASSFLFHMLAYHPEIQERCQKEVDEVLERYNGKLCFEAVKDMKYLEMALRESMRVLPSPGFLLRKTASKYTIPGTNVTLDEGIITIISTESLSLDAQYFEDPEAFKPERFHPDNINEMKKYTFMPFGAGPRACIGERLGIMQSMAGAAAILRKFTLEPSRSSILKPRIDPSSVLVENIIGGLPLALKRRQKAN